MGDLDAVDSSTVELETRRTLQYLGKTKIKHMSTLLRLCHQPSD